MAGIRTGFVTGARAKVTIGGAVMAYAADVSYNISIATVPVETMGKYEVHTNEPVAYTVGGSFSVVRYTKADAVFAKITDQNTNSGAAQGTTTATNVTSATGTLTQGTAPGDHLNPQQLITSSTFDLVIGQKEADGSTNEVVFYINDCRVTGRSAALNKRGVLVDNYTYVGVLAGDDDLAPTGPSSASQ